MGGDPQLLDKQVLGNTCIQTCNAPSMAGQNQKKHGIIIAPRLATWRHAWSHQLIITYHVSEREKVSFMEKDQSVMTGVNAKQSKIVF